MDYIKVFESGKLAIRFYDGTEFECETEQMKPIIYGLALYEALALYGAYFLLVIFCI